MNESYCQSGILFVWNPLAIQWKFKHKNQFISPLIDYTGSSVRLIRRLFYELVILL